MSEELNERSEETGLQIGKSTIIKSKSTDNFKHPIDWKRKKHVCLDLVEKIELARNNLTAEVARRISLVLILN